MFDSLQIRFALLLALMLGLLSNPGFSQDASKAAPAPKVTLTKFGNWVVACPPAGDQSGARCVAQLTMVDGNSKTVLVNWRIGYNIDNILVIDLITPTEVFIAPGAQIAISKTATWKLPFVSCGLQGCLSRVPLNAAMQAKLKTATSATISVAATSKKLFQLKLNTEGLAEALAAITNQ
jgi:invasion protein IalB